MADTAIFDVDGTLLDTNYQHALQVFDSLVAFRYALDGTPLARASR